LCALTRTQVSAARAEVSDLRRSKEAVEATLAATREQLAAAQGQVSTQVVTLYRAAGLPLRKSAVEMCKHAQQGVLHCLHAPLHWIQVTPGFHLSVS
jgi:hypothetical protein